MSRSIRSRLISRLAWLNAWLSNVVKPSLRCPSSRSACLTHLRIAAEGSNARASASCGRPERTSATISRRNSGGHRRCFLAIVDPFFHFLTLDVSTKAGQPQFLTNFFLMSALANPFREISQFGVLNMLPLDCCRR